MLFRSVKLMTLSNYDAMLKTALETGFIRESDLDTLQLWREDPGNWVPDSSSKRDL